jgi:hypothetical protein
MTQRHTLKLGVNAERVTMFIYATNSARPNFVFNGTYTGNGWGDFLLGYINNTATSEQQTATIQQRAYAGYVQDDWKASSRLTFNLGVRYELATPFTEEFDRQSNFVMDGGPCNLQIVTAAGRGRCSLPRSLTFTDFNNFAPRIGAAWRAGMNTAVRGGFGIFYGRDENVGILRRLPYNPPFITNATFTGDQLGPAFLLKDGFPSNALARTGILNLVSWPTHFPMPYVTQWNLSVGRQLRDGYVAEVGYSGAVAHQLTGLVALNQPYPGSGNVNARRPYQGYGTITSYGPYINSTYEGLIAKVERRFVSGLALLAAFTLGHSLDGGPNANDANDPGPQDSRNLRAEKGSSNFDIRQRFVARALYTLPFGKSAGALSMLARNWEVAGIFAIQTGQQFTATLSTDPSGTGTTAHPNRIGDGSLTSDHRGPLHWFDTTAFAAPLCFCFGNSGRNILRGPGMVNTDFALSRNFMWREHFRLQLRAEAFNLFNHPNFGLPGMVIGSPTAGIIGSVTNPERQVQLAMKVYF